MKLINGVFLLLATFCLMFVSCNDEEVFIPDEPDSEVCYDVYFPQDQDVDLFLVPEAPTELTIVVKRGNTLGAITVPYDLTDAVGVFNVGDIVFEDGEDSCSVLVTFDNAEVGVSYSCTIAVTDPMYASATGSNAASITITVFREKWSSLGYAIFNDSFLFNELYDVEISQSGSDPAKFRLADPYFEGLTNPDEGYNYSANDLETGTYLSFQVLNAGDVLNGATITQNDLVYYEPYNTGCRYGSNSSYLWLYHPALVASLATEANWTHNKVLSYQGNGMPAVVQLAPAYYTDGDGQYINHSQDDEMVTITFPGVDSGDYSVNVSAVADDLDVTATVTFGKDVDYARVALVEGADGSDAMSEIENGTIEYQEIYEGGEVKFTGTSGGRHSVVAVTFSRRKARESAYATVRLVDPNETWSVYGAGNYKFTVYWSNTTSGLTIYQSDSDSERFKIEKWASGNDFGFFWDQNTNEVEVWDQKADTTRARYDETVYVDGLNDYFGYGGSTYSNGTFYFALVYYISDGYLAFGTETFTVTRTGDVPFPVSSIVGTYYTYGISYYGESRNAYEKWVFEESNDQSKGNFMITTYNGWRCTTPIYGTLDTTTGSISIYSGKTGQCFYNDYKDVYGDLWDIYFASYLAIQVSYGFQQPDSIELSLLPNGTFIGPMNGDMIVELLYFGDEPMLGWNQAFEYVCGTKESATATSLSVSDKSETKGRSVAEKVGHTLRPHARL